MNKLVKSRKMTKGGRTLGPLPDLERHLPSDWWVSLFNATYLKTDGDVVENDINTKLEVDLLLDALDLDKNDRILDLCCGQGRHLIELAKRGFVNLTGIDRSRYLIRLARRRAKSENLNIRFSEGDARKFSADDSSFDCAILMGNSFGYFASEEDDLAVLDALKLALTSKGYLAIDLADGNWLRDHFEPRSWEWIDQEQLVCRERALSADNDRLVSREVVVHAEKGIIVDQFYAERLYSQNRIQDLLRKAGFSSINVGLMSETHSTRSQDYGMMRNRIFVTARAPAKSRPADSEQHYSEITVILGDPSLPDRVKMGGAFGAEDIRTIRKLKDALGKLSEHSFVYLDNHKVLLDRLTQSRPKFVFNLCDEGLNNQAEQELHVPALLEILGIPYTGSAPNTLSVCYNKSLVRAVATDCDIPVPLETYLAADDQSATLPSVFPALIKPCLGDSSLGINQRSVVFSPRSALERCAELRRELPNVPILIQEFLAGKEYSVGVIGNPGIGMTVLPILEVNYQKLDAKLPKILGYESKWDPQSPYWTEISYEAASLDESTTQNLSHWSTLLFERLGCRDYARFDFRTDGNGVVKLLEVNPNPGWCWDGKLNLMAGFAGMSYSGLLDSIIDAAEKRHFSDKVPTG